MSSSFEPHDIQRIEQRGMKLGYLERQLSILRNPPAPVRLLRPCGIGDGIREIDREARELERVWRNVAGQLTKFVPASGAASRMFSFLPSPRGQGTLSLDDLRARSEAGDAGARQTLDLLQRLDGLPSFPELEHEIGHRTDQTWWSLRDEDPGYLLELLVDSPGLALSDLPKGLLPFHRYHSGPRSAFEEHLVEGVRYTSDGTTPARFHFAVSGEHEAAFRRHADEIAPRLERDLGIRFDIDFSIQDPSTDTIAVDLEGQPVRRRNGDLLLRPGGHGSLLLNLERLAHQGVGIVVIKNIDNIAADRFHDKVALWKRRLIGHALELRNQTFDLLRSLDSESPSPADLARTIDFVTSEFAVELPHQITGMSYADRAEVLRDRLDRPLRVCGVVANRGEPGGGPFWVARMDGSIDGQIVETAQVSQDAEEQQAIWAGSTHFNPVDIVCSLHDRHGKPYDLQRHVDRSTYFVTTKSYNGQAIKVLERPGLWNGAMAAWNTAFVEVPEETFSPVKTLLDLLRPAHQV